MAVVTPVLAAAFLAFGNSYIYQSNINSCRGSHCLKYKRRAEEGGMEWVSRNS